MKIFRFLTTFCVVIASSFTLAQTGPTISLGPVALGEKRIEINLKNFKIVKKRGSKKVRAKIIENSIQWVRSEDNLLIPRARMKILIEGDNEITLDYLGVNIIPSSFNKKYKESELFINLFNPGNIKVYQGKKEIESLTLITTGVANQKIKHLIDYSCVKHDLKIEGLDNEFLSVGCRMERTGKIGNERSRLRISWTNPNLFAPNGNTPPFVSFLTDKRPIQVTLYDKDGNKKLVKISANINKRYRRMKTAIGLGPYAFKSHSGNKDRASTVAPAAMVYSRFDLTEQSSLRAFDALIYRETIFNNLGAYFAYDLGNAFDHRLNLTALLGAQVLSFQFDQSTSFTNKLIYPQGFEVVYRHAFNMENYNLVYGMFISTQSEETYDNLWLRFGKGFFWELNYIRWARENESTTTWGLSIGIPTASFF